MVRWLVELRRPEHLNVKFRRRSTGTVDWRLPNSTVLLREDGRLHVRQIVPTPGPQGNAIMAWVLQPGTYLLVKCEQNPNFGHFELIVDMKNDQSVELQDNSAGSEALRTILAQLDIAKVDPQDVSSIYVAVRKEYAEGMIYEKVALIKECLTQNSAVSNYICNLRHALKYECQAQRDRLVGTDSTCTVKCSSKGPNTIVTFQFPQLDGEMQLILRVGSVLVLEDTQVFVPDIAPVIPGWSPNAWVVSLLSTESGNGVIGIIDNRLRPQVRDDLNGTVVNNVKVRIVEHDALVLRQQDAIKALEAVMRQQEGTLDMMINRPKDISTYHIDMRSLFLDNMTLPKTNTEPNQTSPINVPADLNARQVESLFNSYHPDGRVGLTQGPPGTGKTFSLAETIVECIRNIKFLDESGESRSPRILCCASTHVATNVACEKFIESTKKNGASLRGDVIRFFSPAQAMPHIMGYKTHSDVVDEYTLAAHMENLAKVDPFEYAEYLQDLSNIRGTGPNVSQSNIWFQTVKKQRIQLTTKALEAASVIFTTVSSSDLPGLVDHWKCDILIVDEACFTTDIELAQPLMAHDPRWMLLYGDPKQLQPALLSPQGRSILETSLMMRLMNQGHKRVVLNVGYRCPEQGLQHYSIPFYNDVLHAHPSLVMDRPFATFLAQNLKRLQFSSSGNQFQVTGRSHFFNVNYGQPSISGISTSNFAEVQAIEAFTNALLDVGVKGSNIRICSPYMGQVELLRGFATKNKWEGVKVKTIDGSQGDEADIVIISLSRNRHGLPFIMNEHRINVLMSRHREALYLFGDLGYVNSFQPWTTVLDILGKSNCNGKFRKTLNDRLDYTLNPHPTAATIHGTPHTSVLPTGVSTDESSNPPTETLPCVMVEQESQLPFRLRMPSITSTDHATRPPVMLQSSASASQILPSPSDLGLQMDQDVPMTPTEFSLKRKRDPDS